MSLSTGRHINHRSWTPMPMPSEVVAQQVHRLVRRTNANKNATFTNTRDEDLDVLYAVIKHDEDDVNLAQANDKLTGVDGEDEDDTGNEDYDPEQSNTEDSEDKEDNDSDDGDNDGDDTPEIKILDNDVNVTN